MECLHEVSLHFLKLTSSWQSCGLVVEFHLVLPGLQTASPQCVTQPQPIVFLLISSRCVQFASTLSRVPQLFVVCTYADSGALGLSSTCTAVPVCCSFCGSSGSARSVMMSLVAGCEILQEMRICCHWRQSRAHLSCLRGAARSSVTLMHLCVYPQQLAELWRTFGEINLYLGANMLLMGHDY